MNKIYKINFMQGNYDKFVIGEVTEFDDYYEVIGNNKKKHKIFKKVITSIMEV